MKFARNPKLRIRREKGGYTFYVPAGGTYWLNETARDIFLGLTNNEKEDTIVDFILSKYENTDRNGVKNDVRQVASVLKKTGLLVENEIQEHVETGEQH
jgi:peptidyl-tRNA hydrolase